MLEDPNAKYEPAKEVQLQEGTVTNLKLDPSFVELKSNGGIVKWEVGEDGKVVRSSTYNGVTSHDVIPDSDTFAGRRKFQAEIELYTKEAKAFIDWKKNYDDDPHNPGHPGTHFTIRTPDLEAQKQAQEMLYGILKKIQSYSPWARKG